MLPKVFDVALEPGMFPTYASEPAVTDTDEPFPVKPLKLIDSLLFKDIFVPETTSAFELRPENCNTKSVNVLGIEIKTIELAADKSVLVSISCIVI